MFSRGAPGPPVGQIHSNGASFSYLAPGPHNSIHACLIKSNTLITLIHLGVMYNHWQFNFTANNTTPSLCITYITIIQPSINMQIMLTYPISTSTTIFIIIQFLLNEINKSCCRKIKFLFDQIYLRFKKGCQEAIL